MTHALAHRGPDDAGVWVDAGAGAALGHRRLSVIDLSSEGHQPMASASGRYVIVYNGELYNYVDVRSELERAGASPTWRGHSDTEVMLAAFEHWGPADALTRFNGMFALALWDRRERVLHLARDRSGEKPLYFGKVANTLAFGSELKALRALPGFEGAVDRDALELFLRFNYIPAPWSIYRDIRKLRPGTRAEVRRSASGVFVIDEFAYWDVAAIARDALQQPLERDAGSALDGLESHLLRSVRMRMIADVPVGAFLSGGIDSSLVAAAMQRCSTRPVNTFTIGFDERVFDEAPYAREVARHLRTDHTELYVTGEQARAVVPLLPAMYDEPFADSSQIPTFLLSQLARSRVTVALSGDGGDELFCGYERYVRSVELAQTPVLIRRAATGILRATPSAAIDLLARAVQPALPERLRFAHPAEKMRKLADTLDVGDARNRYVALVSFWRGKVPIAGSAHPCAPHDRYAVHDPDMALASWMMLLDQRTYLPDDILVKVDRASMAVALETRLPLLDHELLAYAWSLPISLKLHQGRGKHILRELLARFVPRPLFERPKRGFAVPLGDWLRGPLRDWAEGLLDAGRLRREGFLDPGVVRQRWHEHLGGERHAQDELWGVLMFQAWREATDAR